MIDDANRGPIISEADRRRMVALRSASGLADLVTLTGTDSEHAAYFEAKREWYDLRRKELAVEHSTTHGLPGNTVTLDDQQYHVHGITHADTPAERKFLTHYIDRFLEDGDVIYCEQGIRSMYFGDVEPVCEMDDYRWAMNQCEKLDRSSHVSDLFKPTFDGFSDDVEDLTSRFRAVAYSLIDSGSDVYGDAFTTALGDVASALLTSHEDLATGEEFEAFTKTRQAANDPSTLADLQRYYEKRFLPQTLEREWLRRHDPELELVTHARNERIADYAVYHAENTPTVRLIVGAAHQPGVTEYLEQYRDGKRKLDGFEPSG